MLTKVQAKASKQRKVSILEMNSFGLTLRTGIVAGKVVVVVLVVDQKIKIQRQIGSRTESSVTLAELLATC